MNFHACQNRLIQFITECVETDFEMELVAKAISPIIDKLILTTPTGDRREELTDINIIVKSFIGCMK